VLAKVSPKALKISALLMFDSKIPFIFVFAASASFPCASV
jgi:hypothetical protein